jgi:hypothetical protein
VQDRAAAAATATANEEGVKRRRVHVWAGGVFNNRQRRGAVLSEARHGDGPKGAGAKKRMRERLGSRSQDVGIHIDQRLYGCPVLWAVGWQANESTRVSAPPPGPGSVAGWRQQLWGEGDERGLRGGEGGEGHARTARGWAAIAALASCSTVGHD